MNFRIKDAVANICHNDYRRTKIGDEEDMSVNITDGIKQGCTVPTTLYTQTNNIRYNDRSRGKIKWT